MCGKAISVLCAVLPVLHMATQNANTALTHATSKIDFQNELQYQASIHFFRSMCKKGILSEEECTIIDTKLCEKYHPSLGMLFSADRLTS
ncbi:MAG: hypothetical protein LUG91_05565 [Ruminococcus sp.]|nr:hypothetical protein [Ruminococcus sp.]